MSAVGTPYSMSPEVCENKPYSFSSDIWATGCQETARHGTQDMRSQSAILLVFSFPFARPGVRAVHAQARVRPQHRNNLLGLVWKIVQESYPPIPALCSGILHELLSAMLAKDPAARPNRRTDARPRVHQAKDQSADRGETLSEK